MSEPTKPQILTIPRIGTNRYSTKARSPNQEDRIDTAKPMYTAKRYKIQGNGKIKG